MSRLSAKGKFLFSDSSKYFIRGVTYGTFQSGPYGDYGSREHVARDFALMAAAGVNSVRTYTPPPLWLLDKALQHGLRVMVGLPWEQHITFLDSGRRATEIRSQLRKNVASCAGHPALLAFAIGNEIPAPIVRWHGQTKVQSFLKGLFNSAKDADPLTLVTYVNYPTTEYLDLPFLDFFSFNVYLEERETLARYLAHLHTVAGDLPVVMAEIGLDSRRNGRAKQAEVLDWQIREAFDGGCSGAFAFAWTDEWHRGGHDIEDWDFGLVARNRSPKPALEAVSKAFGEVPFGDTASAPFFSVIVCSYNGSRTIRQTLEHIGRLEYPNYEVIVVDDGSKDATAEIAGSFPNVRLVRVPNGGLSHARNIGMREAKGDLLAYIDDDAYPDPHWLHHLAEAYKNPSYAAVGGPNIPPPGDGAIAECVWNSPGGPQHVLMTDREAEHIPGCNFSVRKECLMEVGGFDTQFRIAGDDVDACWRLLERGWQIGFKAAAVVWHHRRNSVKAYWKQQLNYGKAEALLEAKWPDKYNAAGHVTWGGRVYGTGTTQLLGLRSRVYHGVWGSSPFQSVYREPAGLWQWIPAMPEWFLGLTLCLLLVLLSVVGPQWNRLWIGLPLLSIFFGIPLALAFSSARKARYPSRFSSPLVRLGLLLLTTGLHLLQPVARLTGRLRYGIRPWRLRGTESFAGFWPRTAEYWTERWRSQEDILAEVEATLTRTGAMVERGHGWDSWDLSVGCSLLGSAQIRAVVEEHGAGKQMFRFRIQPKVSLPAPLICSFFFVMFAWALFDEAWIESAVMLLLGLSILTRMVVDTGFSIGACLAALEALPRATAPKMVARPAEAAAPLVGEAVSQ